MPVANTAVPPLPLSVDDSIRIVRSLGFEVCVGDTIYYHSKRPNLTVSAWKSLHTLKTSTIVAILPPDGITLKQGDKLEGSKLELDNGNVIESTFRVGKLEGGDNGLQRGSVIMKHCWYGIKPALANNIAAQEQEPNNGDELGLEFMSDDDVSDDDVPADVGDSAYQIFYNDQGKLPTKKKMGHIILMLADLENFMVINVSDDIVTPEKYVKSTHPYDKFLSKKGYKTKFILSKRDIADEIIRRVPTKKPNPNNKTVEKLMRMLAETPLTDEDDISFIKQEAKRYRLIINNALGIQEEDVETGCARQTDIDRLRFIILLGEDNIMESYLRSQDDTDRIATDYRNSVERESDWMDLIVEAFNDPDVEATTTIIANLHPKFREHIDCPKGAYTLDRKKAAKMMMDRRGHLRDIVRRYNKSGNGSDMALFDEDSEGEDEIVENEDTYGRFNKERARRRASRRKDDNGRVRNDLKIVDGDDRGSFLLHHPYDLLYWWNEMDRLNLLFFTMNKMDDDNSASSGKTPGNVSRKKHKVSDTVSSKKAQLVVQTELTKHVAGIGKSLASISSASLTSQIENLETRKFDLEMKKLACPSSPIRAMIDSRLEGLNKNIKILEDRRVRDEDRILEEIGVIGDGTVSTVSAYDVGRKQINVDAAV